MSSKFREGECLVPGGVDEHEFIATAKLDRLVYVDLELLHCAMLLHVWLDGDVRFFSVIALYNQGSM